MVIVYATHGFSYLQNQTQEPFVEFSSRCLAIEKKVKLFDVEKAEQIYPHTRLDRLGGRMNVKLSFSLTQFFFFSFSGAAPLNAAFLCSHTDTCLVQVSSVLRYIQKANEKLGVISKYQPHSLRTWLTAREGPARTRSQLASEKQDPSLDLLEHLCF